MQQRTPQSLIRLVVVLALAMSASACTKVGEGGDPGLTDAGPDVVEVPASSTTAPPRPEPSALGRDGLAPEVASFLESASGVYERSTGIWAGFDPADHPVVIVRKDTAGAVSGLIAINHSAPDALGTARAVDGRGLNFASIHLIENPVDAETLGSIPTFEFHKTVGGVDSFVMVDDANDDFLQLQSADYSSTLIHEMFHRFQDEAFEGDLGTQDTEGYPYTPENIALAALEERALVAAHNATNDAERRVAARHFAAIRLARLEADQRVVLDERQEMFEGSARWIEHRQAGAKPPEGIRMANTDESFAAELVVDPTQAGGTKDWYGFGRFYSSGASVIALLDDFGVVDFSARINGNETPSAVLADHLEVDSGNVDELVGAARQAYDADGELDALAAEAADIATTEDGIFDELDGQDHADAEGETEREEGVGEPITDDEWQCLVDNGLDAGGGDISEAQADACFA